METRLVSRLSATMHKVQQRKAGLVAGRKSDPRPVRCPANAGWSGACCLTARLLMSSAGSRRWTQPRCGSRASTRHLHVIERSKIIAARRVPAAAGGPDPRRISAADLQRHALLGWLAWHEPLGEWTLRAGGGFTRRANSCHAVGDPACRSGRPRADHRFRGRTTSLLWPK